MKFKEWNEIAELVGIAAVVGSLIFVGLQMRQAQDIANAERQLTRAMSLIELNNSINAHADIWSRGKSGGELSETEAVIFENLIHAMDEHFFFASLSARGLGNTWASDATRADFVGFLFENPGALRAWESRSDFLQKYHGSLISRGERAYDWQESVHADLAALE